MLQSAAHNQTFSPELQHVLLPNSSSSSHTLLTASITAAPSHVPTISPTTLPTDMSVLPSSSPTSEHEEELSNHPSNHPNLNHHSSSLPSLGASEVDLDVDEQGGPSDIPVSHHPTLYPVMMSLTPSISIGIGTQPTSNVAPVLGQNITSKRGVKSSGYFLKTTMNDNFPWWRFCVMVAAIAIAIV